MLEAESNLRPDHPHRVDFDPRAKAGLRSHAFPRGEVKLPRVPRTLDAQAPSARAHALHVARKCRELFDVGQVQRTA